MDVFSAGPQILCPFCLPVHIEKPGKIVAVAVRPSGMICFTKDAGKLIVCRLVKNRKNMKFLPVIKGIPGIVQNK